MHSVVAEGGVVGMEVQVEGVSTYGRWHAAHLRLRLLLSSFIYVSLQLHLHRPSSSSPTCSFG